MHEVRERMLQERDRAVEREREAASLRLREQSERFDQQLLAQRARLTEDMAQVSSSPFSQPHLRPRAHTGSVCIHQLFRTYAAFLRCPTSRRLLACGHAPCCTCDALRFLQHSAERHSEESNLQGLTSHGRSIARAGEGEA